MHCRALLIVLCLLLHKAAAASGPSSDTSHDPEFRGRVDKSVEMSIAAWPVLPKPPADSPNIVVILLDDIGFADTSTFGGLAQTPGLDRVAASGVSYNNFHTTAMCSPTRAALLSGRNHHRIGFGVAERSGGFPGYNFTWKKNAASIAKILRDHGYSTAAFGKWHNTPQAEISPVGPFDRWPTGLGFEYFYGFLSGINNQWEPSSLFRNTTPVDPERSAQNGYHLTTDITDEAIQWLQTQNTLAVDKPYFLYYATGAVHEPHHVSQYWIDHYRGRFDRGWDALRQDIFARQKALGIIPDDAKLTPRPSQIPAWTTLSADEKRLYARQMEVYAAFVAQTDYEISRLLKAIQAGPGGDNTIIFYIVGDNGSTGEAGVEGYTNRAVNVQDQVKDIDKLGGVETWNQYSAGWAWLGSTPFQWWKGIASHFGATRTPLVVSWPSGIKARGVMRHQFTHVNDVAATIYDVTNIKFPDTVDGVKQLPLDGASFASTFDQADAPAPRDTQYFEMIGNRAIYHAGWVAAAPYIFLGFEPNPLPFKHDDARWELYHVEKDFSQAEDLAKRYPEKLRDLQNLFDREAWRNFVYPLGGGLTGGTPTLIGDQKKFTYYDGQPRLQKTAVPTLVGKSFRITAVVTVANTDAEGIIFAYGSRLSGIALYMKDGYLIYENTQEGRREQLMSGEKLSSGPGVLTFEYDAVNTKGHLFVDAVAVGQRSFTALQSARYNYGDVLSIGRLHSPIGTNLINGPLSFSGAIERVELEVW